MNKWVNLVPKTFGYKLFRTFNIPKVMPFMLTVSVTNKCNSKCKTCNIWTLYRDDPQLEKTELNIREYEYIFRNIGDSIIWFNISGGEPYMRSDLPEILKIMYESSNPKFFTIPTNGLLSSIIVGKTKQILDVCEKAKLIVNVSIDGINGEHDKIRGIEGNFQKVVETVNGLQQIKKEYDNLEIGIHSVVSKFNVDQLSDIYTYIKSKFEPDSYICSPAQNRGELLNDDEDIAPDIHSYEKLVDIMREHVKVDYLSKKGIPKIIQSVRLKYYDLAVEELKQKRQIIPCYAGYGSCQVTPYGDVWPCCTLAYDASMGNLREYEYDFKALWRSEKSNKIRRQIKSGLCYCPMANIHYTNILCNTTLMLKLVYDFL